MKIKIITSVGAVLVVMGFQTLQSQVLVPFGRPSVPSGNQSQQDVNNAMDSAFFMQSAFTGNKIEVMRARLAETRALRQSVKDLALAIIADNKAISGKLNSLAGGKNVDLSKELDSADRAKLDDLSALSGVAFDKRFLAEEVTAHRNAIASYERAANSTDADVKSFAESTLPVLRKQLQMAQTDSIVSQLSPLE